MNQGFVDGIIRRIAIWREWVKKQNPHLLGLVLVLAAFWAAMAFSEPISPRQTAAPSPTVEITPLPAQTPTGEIQAGRPSPTPIPAELLANREQTFGIVFGAVVLVLIVVIGTLSGIAAQRQTSQSK
ncbi:hypothetical protein BECAL_03226 [Bellilinea caldifistulae]|uniref:Uncharacterized protein n=1 Tax=Bellilinea caldifistulae TaxID=360411 RepID=A0A0P6XMC7_9CHLR|nr:hypothetical protein [Bellilinea caldifistulae]KPL76343.1 hypothetical protein AC812_06680 [Bellilinea caldifistulae]GAP12026.1 hypothetical protein BECAL_03226 [Bellilinea caldifistulae]